MKTNLREGASIIFENVDGCIAMQLRDDNFKWGLFGGWSEPGETPQETILREIHEELAVILSPEHLTFLQSFEFPALGIAHVFHYPVSTELDQAVLSEGIAFQFLSPAEISDKPVPTHHQHVLNWYWSHQ